MSNHPSKKRIAVADLGTNTFHLLIAEAGEPLTVLFEEKVAVGLGKGGINQGIITPEAFDRALDCMRYFSETISTYDLDSGIAIGTSAMRSARNGTELAHEIELNSSFKVEIINGEREAAYIFAGVQASGVLLKSPGLIVDIGGGSVEFIIADSQNVYWKKSFEIGGIRLLELFQHHDPILPEEISNLTAYLQQQLFSLTEAVKIYKPSYLVGSSGAFDTLAEMELAFQKRSGKTTLHVFELPLSSFQRMHSELHSKNRAERLAIPGMIPLRVDMIVVAVALIEFLLQEFSMKEIRSCTYALKEGVACQYLRNSNH